MLQASYIVSRCGYSTVMDIAVLQKESILIPTPGQTEQEYLGRHLIQNGFALCIDQKKFELKTALSEVAKYNYQLQKFLDGTSFKEEIIMELLQELYQKKNPAILAKSSSHFPL